MTAQATVLDAVCAAMGEVLGLQVVSPDAGFADLGGHSLLAIQVIAMLRERYGLRARPPFSPGLARRASLSAGTASPSTSCEATATPFAPCRRPTRRPLI
jgi:nonribosomal peptide synthetase DhbF